MKALSAHLQLWNGVGEGGRGLNMMANKIKA